MEENPIIRHFYCKKCKTIKDFEQLDDRCECLSCGHMLDSTELLDLAAQEDEDRSDTVGKALCRQES